MVPFGLSAHYLTNYAWIFTVKYILLLSGILHICETENLKYVL